MNFSIFLRLISSYLLIIIVVLASGIYTIWNLSELNRDIRSITTDDARMIQLSEECHELLDNGNAAEEKYFVSRDERYHAQFKSLEADFARKLAQLKSLAETERKQTLLAAIQAQYGRYILQFDDMVVRAGDRRVPDAEMADYREGRDRVIWEAGQNLRELVRLSSEERDDKLRKIEATSVRTADAIMISLVVAIIMVIIISVINTRSVSVPISRLQEKTKSVARGDFGDPLDIPSPPEIRQLAEAFNAMCGRLRELDQMKIDYIGHLSHELRTPLTAIKEASSMLREGIFAQMPAKQRELETLINEECERLIRTVTRLLDFSMMESGMMPLSVQEASLQPIVEKSMQRFSPVAQRKDISMQMQIQPDLPRFPMDAEKVEVVLENLLSNALKFTPEGGRITVSARQQSDSNRVEVAVSDTGRGIPESGLKEVFEKFRRVDDGKGAVRGTGLGLAIVKHIINAHGGQVWAQSEVGRGCTFTFWLPLPS